MVVIDATMLLLLLNPSARTPHDASGKRIEKGRERIAFMVKNLEKAKVKLILPTPALSEMLVQVDAIAAQNILEEINRSSVFRIESFDTRAAVEVAAMSRTAAPGTRKKRRLLTPTETYAKLKYDRQIVAIAKVNRAKAIYTDDRGLRSLALQAQLRVYGLGDLELPPESSQAELPFQTGEGWKPA